jgi:large subunit ribosomal protein L10
MEDPRPEKVAVVDEVRARLDAAAAAVLTEYRGLTVSDMAHLRTALRAVGADYKVYKNTLVKLAIAGGRHEVLAELLTGPTAIAFVSGEITSVAKALRDYARTNPALVVKGGLHGEGFLSSQDLGALADLPSREVLLARIAGGFAAPLRQLAGLIEALPRNLAYGLKALIDQKGGVPDAQGGESSSASSSSTSEAAPPTPEAEASADAETSVTEAPSAETGVEDASAAAEDSAPSAEGAAEEA